MATNTYVALDKVTVGTATSSVTLSSIASTYTDLILVIGGTLSADISAGIYFNGDTGSNYSTTRVYGNGTSAASSTSPNETKIGITTGTGNVLSTYILNIMNYANTTTYKTVIGRASQDSVSARVGLWRSTSAITSLTVAANGGNWAVGTTFSLYGIKAQVAPGTAKATGGTITYDNFGYVYHTFTSTANFVPSVPLSCDVLVIAGGGSGGTRHAGGGGAGGISFQSGKTISTSTTATVGGGGASVAASGTGVKGNAGSNSSFGAIISNGGGGGGQGTTTSTSNGGSGGGGGPDVGGTTNQGSTDGATGYGNNGGSGYTNNSSIYRGGGGGGAGAVGIAANSGSAGGGGAGLNTWSGWATATSTGVSGYYAGGGGGSSYFDGTSASGGAGGGGAGGANGGTNGTTNTGSGGGADGLNNGSPSGAGGSGIVIIRYSGVQEIK